jgi:methyltransferase (TIGR00027 family)
VQPDSPRSTTAEGTAVCRALGALEAKALLRNPDHLAHHFVTRPLWRAALLPGLRTMARREIERLTPGTIVLHHVRTRLLDRLLLAAVSGGASQVVLIGAGGDSRAHRFRRELEGVAFFEVDHPSTSAWKRARVRRMLAGASDPVRYVPVDFDSQPLEQAVASAGFSSARPTFFLWEGVTMYLRPESVDATFAFVAGCAPGSSIAFDYLHAEAYAHPERFEHAVQHSRFVRDQGEPFTFGLPADPTDLARHLEGRGLRMLGSWSSGELRALYPGEGQFPSFYGVAHATPAPR